MFFVMTRGSKRSRSNGVIVQRKINNGKYSADGSKKEHVVSRGRIVWVFI